MTGRPIATMTVSEYLEFCSHAGSIPAQTPVIASVNACTEKKEDILSVKTSVNPKQNAVEKSAAPANKSSALEMLRSVSG